MNKIPINVCILDKKLYLCAAIKIFINNLINE